MQRIYLTFVFLFVLALGLQAQPSVFGSGLVNGNPSYATYDLADKGAFRQVRLQAGSSGTDRVWEFASGTAASTDYSVNWRPYDGGKILSSFNAVISPVAEEASARYNNNFGGASGLLPNVTAGNYYTVNVTENGPPTNNFMAILETSYVPATVTGVTGPPCATTCGYEVTVTLSNPPAAGEYVYVRYSTDGFATSGFIIVNFNGASGMATIPIANANVAYYVYTSSNSLLQLINAVNTYGDVAHDMLALELGNNGGNNYNYSPCTTSNPVAVCQNTTVQLDGMGSAGITAADIDGGSFDNCDLPSLSVEPASFSCSDVITTTPTDLFFSEYVEGIGDNKYLEIYNGTGTVVDLSNYQVRLYSNGGTSPFRTNTLSGSLNPGAVIVLANSSATIYGGPVTNATAAIFNGNDAIELFNTALNAPADIIGRIGEDPGDEWASGGNSTQDQTLRRKSTVTGGVTTNPASGFPTLATEWDALGTNVISNLGTHGIGTTVTLTATGTGGVQTFCLAVVTVEDNEMPDAVCQDITVDIEAGEEYTLTAADINGGSSDNCTPILSIPETVFDCSDVGNVISVTLTVTDDSGNSDSCPANVTVADGNNICNQAPTAACQPVQVSADINCQGTAAAADFDGGSTDPEMGMLSFGVSPAGPYPLGVTDVTLTVTDPGGASDDCMTAITVVDNTAPTIDNCPGAVTVNADDNCQALVPSLTGSTITLANSVTEFSGAQGANGWYYGGYFAGGFQNFSQLPNYNGGVPQWEDNQAFSTPFLDAFGGHPGVDDFKQAVRRWVSSYTGTVDISLAFFDRDGNCGDGAHVRVLLNGTQVWEYLDIPTFLVTQSFSQAIMAGDILDFVIDPKFSTGCDNTQFTALITASNGLSTSDNCGPVTVGQSPAAGTLVGLGTTQITLTANDGNNDSQPCTVDLTVVDNTAPVAACQSAIVQLDANGTGSITAADVFDAANSSDNCGTVNPQSVSPGSFTCADEGNNTVTLTVNDGNGNTATCSAAVTVENPFPITWYADNDNDTYGDPDDTIVACDQPSGYVLQGGDCDDGNPAVNPGATEACNGVDDDCSGQADDGLTFNDWYLDSDGDTYGAGMPITDCQSPGAGYVLQGGDCDDGNAAVNPGATEACNGVDDDCSGQADDGLTFNDWYLDSDGDTYGAGIPINDCQSPGANYVLQGGDCDDDNPAINPGASEACNGVDDDCSGQADDGLTFNDWYLDSDGDTYGDGVPITDCQSPGAGYVLQGGDCDDGNAAVNPGATEACNGVDDDCDELVDNDDPSLSDNTAPTAACQSAVVQLDGAGTGSLVAADVFDAANSSDNCGTVNPQSVSPGSFTCADVGTRSVTLTVNDGNGNTATCMATVTVEDPTGFCSQVFCFDSEAGSLIDYIEGLSISSSIKRALTRRLELAIDKFCQYPASNTVLSSLEYVIAYTQYQSGRGIPAAAASYIIAEAQALIAAINADTAVCCSGAGRGPDGIEPAQEAGACQLDVAPNPFRSEALLSFFLPEASPVSLEVFNLQGQRVRLLRAETLDAGRHTHNWDGTADGGQVLSAGVYLVRLRTEAGVLVKKVSLVR